MDQIKLQQIYSIISGKNSSHRVRHSIDASHFRLKNETVIKDPYRGFISVNRGHISMGRLVSIYSRT